MDAGEVHDDFVKTKVEQNVLTRVSFLQGAAVSTSAQSPDALRPSTHLPIVLKVLQYPYDLKSNLFLRVLTFTGPLSLLNRTNLLVPQSRPLFFKTSTSKLRLTSTFAIKSD